MSMIAGGTLNKKITLELAQLSHLQKIEKSLQFWKKNVAGQKIDKNIVGNKSKLFLKENGQKGAYNFLKIPYYQFHCDYQPDGMHEITDVVKTVMNSLTGNVDINKLCRVKEEFKSVRPEKIADKIVTLTVKEKTVGNNQCKPLKFPQDFFGFSGNV